MLKRLPAKAQVTLAGRGRTGRGCWVGLVPQGCASAAGVCIDRSVPQLPRSLRPLWVSSGVWLGTKLAVSTRVHQPARILLGTVPPTPLLPGRTDLQPVGPPAKCAPIRGLHGRSWGHSYALASCSGVALRNRGCTKWACFKERIVLNYLNWLPESSLSRQTLFARMLMTVLPTLLAPSKNKTKEKPSNIISLCC